MDSFTITAIGFILAIIFLLVSNPALLLPLVLLLVLLLWG
jgi:hypothetical protein